MDEIAIVMIPLERLQEYLHAAAQFGYDIAKGTDKKFQTIEALHSKIDSSAVEMLDQARSQALAGQAGQA